MASCICFWHNRRRPSICAFDHLIMVLNLNSQRHQLMTDTESKLPAATDKPDDNDLSFWARKLNLTSFRADPWGWNKEWEKALHTLSFSEDVYPVMSSLYARLDPTKLSGHFESVQRRVSNLQNVIGKVCDIEKEDLATGWLFFSTGERKRHLLKGMDEACKHASLEQDSRALCPEITISAML